MTEAQWREHYVDTLRGWIGAKEGDELHKRIIKTYNSLLPLPFGYRMTYKDPWCAATVSAAAIEAGLTDIIFRECSCTRMIELFKQHGRWQEDDSYIPQPGDLIFYDWHDTGKGNCTGNPEHVGVVERVANGQITVIEGNYHDAVDRRTIPINARYIRGYGCPDYASLADGDFPDCASRTDDVYQVRVTSDALRIRSGPDAASDLIGYLEYGDTVTISEETNGWGRLVNGEWIKLEFTERVKKSEEDS